MLLVRYGEQFKDVEIRIVDFTTLRLPRLWSRGRGQEYHPHWTLSPTGVLGGGPGATARRSACPEGRQQ